MTTPWTDPPSVPPLAGDVHVWRASLPAFTQHLGRLGESLDEGERARAGRFLLEADRARYVVSHGLLRLLLARHLDREPASLRFTAGPRGKPSLASPDDAELRFNLSHSGDLVLLALARGSEVGVDVECWSPGRTLADLERTGARAFSPAERAALGALDPDRRPAGFFAIWSRKEAYLKAVGAGVGDGLHHFDVSVEPEAACLVADRRDPGAAAEWAVRDLPIDAGYSAAIAIRRREPTVVTMNAAMERFDRV